jgi:hypothetical protein
MGNLNYSQLDHTSVRHSGYNGMNDSMTEKLICKELSMEYILVL